MQCVFCPEGLVKTLSNVFFFLSSLFAKVSGKDSDECYDTIVSFRTCLPGVTYGSCIMSQNSMCIFFFGWRHSRIVFKKCILSLGRYQIY